MDKLGRVFVPTTKKFPETVASHQVVEGEQFSCLHLHVLGNNVENDKKYNGCKFSIDVCGHQLTIPAAIGQSPKLDPAELEAAFLRALETAKEIGFLEEENDENYERKVKLLRESGMHILPFLLTRDRNESIERDLLSLSSLLCHATCMTNFIRCANVEPKLGSLQISSEEFKDTKLSYAQLSRLKRAIAPVLLAEHVEGQQDPLDSLLENPLELVASLLESLEGGAGGEADEDLFEKMSNMDMGDMLQWTSNTLTFFSLIRKSALEKEALYGCKSRPYLVSMVELLDACLFENSSDWQDLENLNKKRAAEILPTMTSLRRATCYGRFLLEAVLLDLGINLDDQVRGTALFRLICSQVEIHIQKIADIFTFHYQKTTNSTVDNQRWWSNEVHLVKKFGGLTEEDAMGRLVNEANSALTQIETLSCLLQNMSSEHEKENAAKFNVAVRQLLTACIQWHALTQKHTNLSMDCYIKAETKT